MCVKKKIINNEHSIKLFLYLINVLLLLCVNISIKKILRLIFSVILCRYAVKYFTLELMFSRISISRLYLEYPTITESSRHDDRGFTIIYYVFEL